MLGGVVAFLLAVTFKAETPLDTVAAHPRLRVHVTAAQWSWRFEYPGGRTVTAVSTWRPPIAEVPTGEEVEFWGSSNDVIHGFYVPRLHFQRQFLPGYVTRFDLRFDSPGLLSAAPVRCTAASGTPRCTSSCARSAAREFESWLRSGGEAGSSEAGGTT